MTPELSAAIQQTIEVLLLTIISIFVPVLVRVLLQFLSAKKQEVENRIQQTRTQADDDFLRAIKGFAELAVLAAEQTGLRDEAIRNGRAKKALAVEYMQNLLTQRGWTNINLTTVDAAIEAAVLEGLHRFQVLSVTAQSSPSRLGNPAFKYPTALDEVIDQRCTTCPGDRILHRYRL